MQRTDAGPQERRTQSRVKHQASRGEHLRTGREQPDTVNTGRSEQGRQGQEQGLRAGEAGGAGERNNRRG
eukprot:7407504-Alexandrium_andersonii.AAC.1